MSLNNKGQIIFENEHYVGTYFPEKKYVLSYWTGSTNLTSIDFKDTMKAVALIIERCDIKGFLIDTNKFHFTIEPALQEWYDKEVVPLHYKAGVRKMAFLLSEEYFVQMSIEQTMSEQGAKMLQTKYFKSLEEAEKWLLI